MNKASKDAVEKLLRGRQFELITPRQWGQIFLSLISTDETERAAFEKRSPREGLVIENPIWVTGSLGLHSRGEGDFIPAILFFKDELSLTAREELREGLTDLAKMLHAKAKINKDSASLLFEILRVSGSLDGAIFSRTLQHLAEDQELESRFRSEVACQLVEKQFGEAPPTRFWDELQEQLPQYPELLTPCLLYEIYGGGGSTFSALELMKKVKPTNENQVVAIPSILRKGLDEVGQFHGWQSHLKQTLATLPRWALDLLRKDVVPFTKHKKEIACLMPKSSRK